MEITSIAIAGMVYIVTTSMVGFYRNYSAWLRDNPDEVLMNPPLPDWGVHLLWPHLVVCAALLYFNWPVALVLFGGRGLLNTAFGIPELIGNILFRPFMPDK